MTCAVSAVLAALLLVSGGRYTPLPRLGCDRLPSVMAGALAVASAVAVPLRHAGKQRQRQAATSLPVSGMAASAPPRQPHPPVFFAALALHGAWLISTRHLRGMIPLSQAPPAPLAPSSDSLSIP